MTNPSARRGFTLIELLVVIAILALLMGLLAPALSGARQRGYAAKCLAQLRELGRGMAMYTQEHGDVLVPGRLPNIDDCNAYADILGGRKYRPTCFAMMGNNVGCVPFDDPMPCGSMFDRFGEKGNRQNYSNPVYVCPSTADWTDERNSSYGYNYQFLGNSRLLDPADLTSYKNWPVVVTRLRDTSNTVAMADAMGTAATFAAQDRHAYTNNGSDPMALGNEGFNLDPPRIDHANGEAAGFPDERAGADPRHLKRCNVVWVDGHGEADSLEALGYRLNDDGSFRFDGDNSRWSGKGQDVAWQPGYSY